MKRVNAVGFGAGLSCCLLMASPLRAQSTDGAFRLSLDGIVYAGEFATWATPVNPDVPAVELETTNTNAGLYAGSLGLGFGYAFNSNGVIGARLLHSSSTSNVARDALPAVSTTRFTLLPYAEYVANVSPSVQPFVAGVLGFQSGSTEAGEAETSTSAFLLGFSAGLHLFPTDAFSIDPYLAYYRAGGSVSMGSVDVDYSANAVLLGFSISGWIGGAGDGVQASPDATPVVVTETRAYAAPAEPAPRPAARLRMVEDDDLLTGVIALDSGQLTLLGRPESDAETIAVRVTVAADVNKIDMCRTGALLAGNHRFELRDIAGRTREHGSQTVALLQGNVGSRELSTFTEAEDARIVLCGRIFTLRATQREDVGQYFEQFKQLAIEAKTWEKPVPPASAAPAPEAPPAADTPPPASPPPAPKAPAPSSAPAKQPAPKPSNTPAPGAPSTPPASNPAPSGSARSPGAPPTGSFE